MERTLHCYAEGRDGKWEAICLDLDVAVQGESFEEVYHSLHKAVSLYLESVLTLPEDQRSHLLKRPAPLSVRWKFFTLAFRSLFGDYDRGGQHHQFTLPCAA